MGNANHQQRQPNRPTHEVYLVRDGKTEDDKAFWNRIGAAWPHKDGKGFAVILDGDIVIRERKEKETETA